MALLNNRYTDKHLSPMPFQTLKAGIFSAIGMCLMSLVIMICNKDNVSINGFTDDYMVSCIFIVFWFNNVNVISLILFHYLKISTKLIYNPVGVVVEGAIYYLLARGGFVCGSTEYGIHYSTTCCCYNYMPVNKIITVLDN